MPLYEVNGQKPVVGKGTWIAPSAEIIGDVVIGDHCFIGFGAVIRGDFGKIVIGNHSLVEDAVVIHCASKVLIGDYVIIGHKAMLHDTTIGDHVLIGMMAMICDFSEIQERAIVAEQTLVRKRQVIPPYMVYAGSPAREIGKVTQRHIDQFNLGIDAYNKLTEQYLNTFK